MGLVKRTYVDGETVITADNLNDIQDEIIQNASDISTKGTYSKPSGGIPSTDMTTAVQTSLGKADTALQSSDIDSTLTVTGKAADAKKTGDEISGVKNTLNTIKSDLGIVEDTNTATHTIAKGQYVIWKDALYRATQAIPLGTTLSNSNLTAVDNGGLNAVTSRDSGFITTFPAGLTGGTLHWERIGPVVAVQIAAGSSSGTFINTVIASGLPTNVLDSQYVGLGLWGDTSSQCQIKVDGSGQMLMNVNGAYNSSIFISYVYLTNDY